MDEHGHNVALFFGLTPEGGGVPGEHGDRGREGDKGCSSERGEGRRRRQDRFVATTSGDAIGGVRHAGNRAAGKELSQLSIPGLLANGWAKYTTRSDSTVRSLSIRPPRHMSSRSSSTAFRRSIDR